MSSRSPSGTSSPATGVDAFSTGVLSPVSPASSISSVAATSMRPSAGTLSPASKDDDVSRARAPRPGSRPARPSRRTCALITSIFWSAATLSAALPSWFRPRTALSTVRPMITRPVELLQGDDADDRRADQHELHQVPVLAQERLPARLLRRLRELVRPDLRAPPLHLGGVEPGAGRRRAARTPRPATGRARRSGRGRPSRRSPSQAARDPYDEVTGRSLRGSPRTSASDRHLEGWRGSASPASAWDRDANRRRGPLRTAGAE